MKVEILYQTQYAYAEPVSFSPHLFRLFPRADRHLTVRKQVAGGTTVTSVRILSGDDRIEELAELIGGQRITATTRAQATELLETGSPAIATAPKARTTTKASGRKLKAG